MDKAREAAAGPSFQNASQCPMYPRSLASTPSASFGLPPQSRTLTAALITAHPAGQRQTEALYRVSCSRSSQKRGPPSSFFL